MTQNPTQVTTINKWTTTTLYSFLFGFCQGLLTTTRSNSVAFEFLFSATKIKETFFWNDYARCRWASLNARSWTHGRHSSCTTGARQLTVPAHASPNDVIVRLVLSVGDAWCQRTDATSIKWGRGNSDKTLVLYPHILGWTITWRESSIRNKQFN